MPYMAPAEGSGISEAELRRSTGYNKEYEVAPLTTSHIPGGTLYFLFPWGGNIG